MNLRSPLIFLAILTGLWLGALSYLSHHNRGDDPDHLYHLSIARQISANGSLPTLPQTDNLSWSRHYVDKEFLFHQVLALGWSLGGERGAEVAGHALSWIVITLFVTALFIHLPNVTWVGQAVAAVVLLSSPFFMIRLSGLRPHNWGQACALLLVIAAGLRRTWLARGLAFATSGLWFLGYATPFLILPFFGVFAVLGLKQEKYRALLAPIAVGLASGMLLHPDSPDVWLSALANLRIATVTGASKLYAGAELTAPTLGGWLTRFTPQLIALAMLGFAMLRSRSPKGPIPWLALFFCALATFNYRAIEYAVPLLALSAALMLPMSKRFRLAGLGALLAASLVVLPAYSRPARSTLDVRLEAVRALPVGAYKVYNCTWNLGPYLLYARPDLKFVDALDPQWLMASDPERAHLKEALLEGRVPDAALMVSEAFGARFIFCEDPGLARYLKRDPRLEFIFDRSESGGPWIAEIKRLDR